MPPKQNRYDQIIEKIFEAHYSVGMTAFTFPRGELEAVAEEIKIDLPKNLGDIIYSFRYRYPLPQAILQTAPEGQEWVIRSVGRGIYEFRLGKINRILPQKLLQIKVPDATPEIIAQYSLGDEQALLAKIRYNRLIDIFLGITSYSMQNHLRTSVSTIGQIEVDELYVGINRNGSQFVIPVQAKGKQDQIGIVQTEQDIACCKEKFPNLICRSVSVQFLEDGVIAMFELAVSEGEVCVIREKHYRLVAGSDIAEEDLELYSQSGEE